MAIARRPLSNKSVGNDAIETAVDNFIAGTNHNNKTANSEQITPKIKPKKVGIMVYFDPEVLALVDREARKQGLSRSSWLHTKAIEAIKIE